MKLTIPQSIINPQKEKQRQKSFSKRKNSLVRATQKVYYQMIVNYLQALKTIDHYQKRVTHIPHIQQQAKMEPHKFPIRQIYTKNNNKIQCLPNSTQFLKLQWNKQFVNLKIVIKNVKSKPFTFSVGFDKKYPSSYNSDFNYSIKNQNIILINKNHHNKINFIYFGIKPQSQLLMFTLRVQQGKTQRAITEVSQKSDDIKLQLYKSATLMPIKSKLMNSRAQSLQKLSRKNIKVLSPVQKKKNIEIKRQIEQQKAQSARINKQKIDLCKIKLREMRQKASQSKNLVVKVQKQMQQNRIKRGQIIKNITPLIYLSNALGNFNQQVQQRQRLMNIAIKVRKLINQFQKIMKRKLRQGKQQIYSYKHRNLMGVNLFSTFLARSTIQYSQKKANKIAVETIQKLRVGCMINNAFDTANEYRRKIRIIQRFWIKKFGARTEMLQYYGNTQVQKMMTAMQRLKPIYNLYKQSTICHKFVIEYQKDEASKLKDYFQMYKIKVEEIKNYQKMNQQIKLFNSSALKKRQKQYLQVPVMPNRPQAKFFRNIQNFKALIRGWLQVQHRKYLKKTRKQNEQSRKISSQIQSPLLKKKISKK